MRFILNLKELNSYMDPPHFKLEDWRTVVRLMLPDFEMSSIDLEDAYLVVPIHPSYRKFLRFQWRGTTYEWAALPFGLATAPYIFSKILRPAIKLLRSQGFDFVVYLDDFLLLASSKPACRDNVQAHLKLLGDLGFVINYSKSELEPSRQRKFLGFIFNSEQQSVSIPKDRRRKLFSLVAKFSPGSTCTIRDFASMIGSLVSICPAVQYGLLYTKSFEREKFYNLISAENNYAAKMTISNSLKKDYLWWLTILSDNYQTNHIRSGPYACEIFTDASLSGWGASCSLQRTHGWWSETDKSRHINYLELKAIFYALKCFAKDLSDCDILLRVDNTTAISYINRFGSVQHPHLSSLAKEIWQWCEARNLFLFASYIASGDNVIADEESRQQVPDTEWSLSSRAFNSILREYGPFDIDLFASVLNAKCSIYVSWFPDPGAWTIDAFTLSWRNFFFYAFPPFILIPRVLRKIVDDRAEGILVVPWWPSQPWFPLFNRLLISKPLIFSPSKDLLSCPSRSHHPSAENLSLAAGRVSGWHSSHVESRTRL
ncbi:PREDICTED: uncharacterized protein LOC105555726 [Vollenhovia emeryi]|uniref:uncharacterized protein LOC105555726 n=1 Tax=Vollenhovia emeryi TaxID=411798 RepID=UPI0005F472D6|nr:PREDICTED: uncharacterized protein LOC105555726 [Vollenhovia emeryi]